jgi:hypothetical protein
MIISERSGLANEILDELYETRNQPNESMQRTGLKSGPSLSTKTLIKVDDL